MRTRRPFKAFLAWNKEEGKVTFEFAPRDAASSRRARPAAAKAAPAAAARSRGQGRKSAGGEEGPRPRRPAATPKAPRKPGAGLKPSDALAAVIGAEPVARTQVIKKLWDYIKANGLQDAANKRAINADAKLQAGVRQGPGHDVRARRHRRQAPRAHDSG